MNVFVPSPHGALFLVAVVVLGLELPYLAYQMIRGFRVYLRFRGTRVVTCPETHKPAVIAIAARSMGLQAILNEPCLHIDACSRWPICQNCGQDCLRQIEHRPVELSFSAAIRPS